MFFSANVAFASLPPFLPTIINEYAKLCKDRVCANVIG